MNTEDSRDIIKLTDCFKALSIDMQTNLTITMISGILLHIEVFKRDQSLNTSLNKDYEVSDEIIKKELFAYFMSLQQKKLSLNNCSLTVLCPHQFLQIQKDDIQLLCIPISLNFENNLQNIRNAGQSNGGNGGQFIIYSNDNRVIMKTMSDEDLSIFDRMKVDYFQYVIGKKGQTLLAKIYGIFRF